MAQCLIGVPEMLEHVKEQTGIKAPVALTDFLHFKRSFAIG